MHLHSLRCYFALRPSESIRVEQTTLISDMWFLFFLILFPINCVIHIYPYFYYPRKILGYIIAEQSYRITVDSFLETPNKHIFYKTMLRRSTITVIQVIFFLNKCYKIAIVFYSLTSSSLANFQNQRSLSYVILLLLLLKCAARDCINVIYIVIYCAHPIYIYIYIHIVYIIIYSK